MSNPTLNIFDLWWYSPESSEWPPAEVASQCLDYPEFWHIGSGDIRNGFSELFALIDTKRGRAIQPAEINLHPPGYFNGQDGCGEELRWSALRTPADLGINGGGTG